MEPPSRKATAAGTGRRLGRGGPRTLLDVLAYAIEKSLGDAHRTQGPDRRGRVTLPAESPPGEAGGNGPIGPRRESCTMRIAINGLGRVGRALLRQAVLSDDLEVVAVNDLADPQHAGGAAAPGHDLRPLPARRRRR